MSARALAFSAWCGDGFWQWLRCWRTRIGHEEWDVNGSRQVPHCSTAGKLPVGLLRPAAD